MYPNPPYRPAFYLFLDLRSTSFLSMAARQGVSAVVLLLSEYPPAFPGFKLQCTILQHMVQVVVANRAQAGVGNQRFAGKKNRGWESLGYNGCGWIFWAVFSVPPWARIFRVLAPHWIPPFCTSTPKAQAPRERGACAPLSVTFRSFSFSPVAQALQKKF